MTGRQICALLMLALLTGGAFAHGDHDAQDATRLIQALDAAPGSVLADVGAGSDAPLTTRIARHVGPTGRVYATEIDAKTIEGLRETIDKAGVKNVDIVEGHPLRTNLPPGCCDGIYMRNVYHHFADPRAMNASLLQALKPGGRLAIIDLQPRGPEAKSPEDRDNEGQHAVGIDSVRKELGDAGFEVIASGPPEEGSFLVVARKPATP